MHSFSLRTTGILYMYIYKLHQVRDKVRNVHVHVLGFSLRPCSSHPRPRSLTTQPSHAPSPQSSHTSSPQLATPLPCSGYMISHYTAGSPPASAMDRPPLAETPVRYLVSGHRNLLVCLAFFLAMTVVKFDKP